MGRFKVGDIVRVIGQNWPTNCMVIGHHNGDPIIQPESWCCSDESVETLSEWSLRLGISDEPTPEMLADLRMDDEGRL